MKCWLTATYSQDDQIPASLGTVHAIFERPNSFVGWPPTKQDVLVDVTVRPPFTHRPKLLGVHRDLFFFEFRSPPPKSIEFFRCFF